MSASAFLRWVRRGGPIAIVATVALKALCEPVRPEDLWWHLGMGRLIVATHRIPHADPFSFTCAGAPYFDQAWLAQIILYAMHRAAGLGGLLVFDFAIVLLALALVMAASLRRGARFEHALIALLVVAPLAMRGWAVRPQALVVPLFALVVFILARWRHPRAGERAARWPLVLLPFLTALWANLHGSFPLAIALVVLTLVGALVDDVRRSVRDLGLAAAACLVAPGANPRGVEIVGYVKTIATNAQVHAAREWQPLHLRDAEGVYVALLLVGVVALAVKKRAPRGDIVLVLPFVVLELVAIRNGIWLSLVLAPCVAGWLAPRDRMAPLVRDEPAARSSAPSLGIEPLRGALRAALVTAFACSIVPWLKPLVVPKPYGALVWERRTPVRAAAQIARDAHRPHHLFARAAFGSYLIWALPDQPVFADPRLELFPPAVWADLFALERGELADGKLIASYGLDGFLVDRHEEPDLYTALVHERRFELRYEDDDTAYFAEPLR